MRDSVEKPGLARGGIGEPSARQSALIVEDHGSLSYERGLELQAARRDEVLSWRREGDAETRAGFLLLLEHDPPVITVSRRPTARQHLLATEAQVRAAGVEIAETDRGGDITYHGPGQLIAYPILDLNRLRLGLHDYMRLLEEIVIGVCRSFGVQAHRDVCATGVWVGGEGATVESPGGACNGSAQAGRKICAMGVRVGRWVSTHGLALNVSTNLDHFNLIVPCGLAGRSVTSLERELGASCPEMGEVKSTLSRAFDDAVVRRMGLHDLGGED